MNKCTLLIMRHAKSDWSVNRPDFGRPLNKRGLKDAARMGKWLRRQELLPDTVVSSPAKRALHTTQIVCEQAGMDRDAIITDDRIYEAELGELLDVINEHIQDRKSMLITGHNPGLDYLVRHLCNESPDLSATGKLMTTAAIAILEFRKGFSDKPGSGQMLILARPKEI